MEIDDPNYDSEENPLKDDDDAGDDEDHDYYVPNTTRYKLQSKKTISSRFDPYSLPLSVKKNNINFVTSYDINLKVNEETLQYSVQMEKHKHHAFHSSRMKIENIHENKFQDFIYYNYLNNENTKIYIISILKTIHQINDYSINTVTYEVQHNSQINKDKFISELIQKYKPNDNSLYKISQRYYKIKNKLPICYIINNPDHESIISNIKQIIEQFLKNIEMEKHLKGNLNKIINLIRDFIYSINEITFINRKTINKMKELFELIKKTNDIVDIKKDKSDELTEKFEDLFKSLTLTKQNKTIDGIDDILTSFTNISIDPDPKIDEIKKLLIQLIEYIKNETYNIITDIDNYVKKMGFILNDYIANELNIK